MARRKKLLHSKAHSTHSTETLTCWLTTCLLRLLLTPLLMPLNLPQELLQTTRCKPLRKMATLRCSPPLTRMPLQALTLMMHCKLQSTQTLPLTLQNLLPVPLKMHSCSDSFKTTMETFLCFRRV